MSTTVPAPQAQPEDGKQPSVVVVFIGLMLVLLMAALDQTIVATALPTIVGDLGGLSHISWVVTAYMLAQTAVTPIYGKLGDLYGRKIVLQAGLILFLVGSALCGLSQTFGELVVFRAVQGLGGGGLMVSTMAAIGDVVPPRDRGRYQGYFGAVFGMASVIGPLLGGFLTTNLTWRWIFYVNLPIGVLAFIVLAATLPSRKAVGETRIDYAGAALLAAALSAVVLTCTLGGVDYAWTSPTIIGLIALSVVLVVAFVLVERRVAEPVLPTRLFRNRVFTVTSAIGLVVGFALFGSVTYLPLFLQVVLGASPTGSGLQILPLMAGVLITSIGSGQLISRTGRYKRYPIAGTALMVVGLYLLSTLDATTTRTVASAFMFVLGLGLGLVMQVLVLAVQNAVDYADLGVATSGATLFRSIGGSVGTAILGSIFSSHLKSGLADRLQHSDATAQLTPAELHKLSSVSGNPEELKRLPPAIHDIYLASFTHALDRVFTVAACIAAAAFVLSWLLDELPLRNTVAANASSGVGEAFAQPRAPDSLAELSRALTVLVGQEGRRHLIEQVATRAGVTLSPAACWLLTRVAHDRYPSIEDLCAAYAVPVARGQEGLRELLDRNMVVPNPDGDTAAGPQAGHTGYALTQDGAVAAERLVAERRATFERMLDGWEPDNYGDIAGLLNSLAVETGLQPPPGLARA